MRLPPTFCDPAHSLTGGPVTQVQYPCRELRGDYACWSTNLAVDGAPEAVGERRFVCGQVAARREDLASGSVCACSVSGGVVVAGDPALVESTLMGSAHSSGW